MTLLDQIRLSRVTLEQRLVENGDHYLDVGQMCSQRRRRGASIAVAKIAVAQPLQGVGHRSCSAHQQHRPAAKPTSRVGA